ncbi:MAG: hypothetical protein ABIH39_06360 [Candidatus Margulisiibacteriota bacterium]
MPNSFIKEINVPGLTPRDALAVLRGSAPEGAPCFLFESASPDGKPGQYSLLGVNPFHMYKSSGENPLPVLERLNREYWGNDLPGQVSGRREQGNAELESQSCFKSPPLGGFRGLKESIPFLSGIVGYFSYDMLHHLENIPRVKVNDLQMPDAYFMFFDTVVVFEHETGKVFVCVTRVEGEADAEQKADYYNATLDSGFHRNDVLELYSTPTLQHSGTLLQHVPRQLRIYGRKEQRLYQGRRYLPG